jgi:hypothetical protein
MTPNPQSALVICLRRRAPGALFLGVMALLSSGCMAAKKRPTVAWQTASLVHPIIPPVRAADASPLPEVTSVPELVIPSNHIAFPPARPAPPRPRGPVTPGAANDTNKPDGPLIAPQVTAEESASAQQEINASLSASEKNLEGVRGKKLNAVQVDMVNKTRGFMNDAREAARSGDWARARSLAKKALVLSEELARSIQ